MKKVFKYIYASYLFHLRLKKRISYLKETRSVIAIFDHDPSPQQFEKYIEWLLNKGFEFISLSELIVYLENKTELNSSKICFTLDDGWRNNLKLLPIIEKYNIPVTIFIPTYAIETGYFRDTLEQLFSGNLPVEYQSDFKKLYDIPNKERKNIDELLYEKAKGVLPREAISINELKLLSEHSLISIGLHTHTHPVLLQCTDEEIKTEININRKKLKEYTGNDSSVLAIPYGSYNEHTLQILNKNRINYIATSVNGVIDPKSSKQVIPRNGIARASFYENCCRMLDFWYPNTYKIKQKLNMSLS